MRYLDTSAFAKLYVVEWESEGVAALVDRNAGALFTSIATYAEVFSVLVRCCREVRISGTSTWWN